MGYSTALISFLLKPIQDVPVAWICHKITSSDIYVNKADIWVLWYNLLIPWWRHQMEIFPRYWPFVRGIHRSPVNSPHKGQWRRALMFSLICTRINGWVHNGEAGDSRRHHAHHDITVMQWLAVSKGKVGFTLNNPQTVCPTILIISFQSNQKHYRLNSFENCLLYMKDACASGYRG